MSLQATEAVLLDMDKEGNILREDKIAIDLVQRGDILKVTFLLLYIIIQEAVISTVRWSRLGHCLMGW